MIRFNNVTKLYGAVIGLNDVCLQLEPGAYGLLGPNGSGKSTLINLLSGQLRPSLGGLSLFDSDPWRHKGVLRRVGVCPERDVLYDNVTAYQWVKYLVSLYGIGAAESGRRAEATLEQVGMGRAMHRRIGGYSLGMRQRTKLAQALAHDPDLLILDEPFHGLDPIGRHEMTELLRSRLNQGRSLLLASHVLHEVEAVTERFLLICNGRLLASGEASEIRSLLDDIPNEIRIRATHRERLARRLAEDPAIEALEFCDDGCTLVVATRSPAALYAQLPQWVGEDSLQIDEVSSADNSLQHLFDTLMRIHRGEL
ncbi:MAG: ABC transporter ATP-binding protein [Pirellulaceae bacterium]